MFRAQNQCLATAQTSVRIAPIARTLLANLSLLNQGVKKPLGFLNPKLYALGAAGGAFRDILTGDNTLLPAPGYSAQAGWDACCGLGSPDSTRLLAALSA